MKAINCIDIGKLKRGLKLYFTFDEEINFKGIDLLIRKKEKFPEYLILSEPTDLKPIIATKGCMEMKVTFFGKSAHSSTPNKGESAIIKAYNFISELLDFAKELENDKNNLFSIPYTTINVGKINGGDAINKVADKCVIEFDARTILKEHNEIIKKRLENILKKYDCEFDIGINIEANINEDNEMINVIEEISGNKRIAENYVTEASFIKGSNSVVLGLGPVTAHQCNEHIEISKLNKLEEIYEKIIKYYCY